MQLCAGHYGAAHAQSTSLESALDAWSEDLQMAFGDLG